MHRTDRTLHLSATDLANFLGCRHRGALDHLAALGRLKPIIRNDPLLDALRQRGIDHEQRYADTLRAQGRQVVDLGALPSPEAAVRTQELLHAGTDVILQAVFQDEPWFGKPDVLLRVDTPSSLGPFSYEVADTKLTTDTRAGTILQLALYSELLGHAQGRPPERFHVVTPDPDDSVQSYRLDDFTAYHRLVQSRLRAFVAGDPDAASTYPEPVTHCDVCRWWSRCDAQRRADDHLSFVTGITGLQRRELGDRDVATLTGLASLPLPLPFRPRRGAAASLVRAREQARLQLASRGLPVPLYELLPLEPGLGLAHLPAPSPGDLFLDLEGDSFARIGGREYLFGLVGSDDATYRGRWAYTDEQERAAFEATVDEIISALHADPSLHVYHYGAYEPAALKRLMGRHATRETEIDRLLRGRVLVDLLMVTRHALRAGVESYSLKALEALHGFTRDIDLREAGVNKRHFEYALEVGEPESAAPEVRAAVLGYNRDDCISTRALRDWLEARRTEVEAGGTPIARPAPPEDAAPESVSEREARIRPLREALLADVPARDRTPEQHARYLLAHALDFHRREDKVSWWEYFRLEALDDEELLDDRAGIAELEFVGPVPGSGKLPTHRYRYSPQDTDVKEDMPLFARGGTKLGTVAAIDRVGRTVDVKKRKDSQELHPSALFAYKGNPDSEVKCVALERLARDVVDHGLGGGPPSALLLRSSPRLREQVLTASPGESPSDVAIRVAPHLDRTVLPIQGPPGSGKTYTGARMIAELARRGLCVGVTAVSHKVIEKLLLEVGAADPAIPCLRKVTDEDERGGIEQTTNNEKALQRVQSGTVVGGTTWLWSRPEAAGVLDVLFVDEAGQMALAEVLAVSGAAGSLVLLGDPQQLDQPQRASHPDGCDESALEHILGERETIVEDQGIFLAETRRLAPAVCEFTSSVFYEGKLHSYGPLAGQRISGTRRFDGAGLWVIPVEHVGNQSSSAEEVARVCGLVDELLASGSSWVDEHGVAHPLVGTDILVVAPYNAHVALLEEALAGTGARVGTVDCFQGQEAPVVIYSMATSSPEEAPRGMEFLYSRNRLNVATSRARCACFVVASPRLFEPECRTPRQIELANALCRFVEMARVVG